MRCEAAAISPSPREPGETSHEPEPIRNMKDRENQEQSHKVAPAVSTRYRDRRNEIARYVGANDGRQKFDGPGRQRRR